MEPAIDRSLIKMIDLQGLFMRTTFPAAFAALLLSSAAAFCAEHTKDSLDTVKKKIADKSAVLLDVREKKEWDEGHLKGAAFVPLSDLKKGIEAEKLSKQLGLKKGTIIYVHCAAGGRCLPASDILIKAGFDARPLKQGYQPLLEAGFPKAEPEEKKDATEKTGKP